jgi:hypothetical protein
MLFRVPISYITFGTFRIFYFKINKLALWRKSSGLHTFRSFPSFNLSDIVTHMLFAYWLINYPENSQDPEVTVDKKQLLLATIKGYIFQLFSPRLQTIKIMWQAHTYFFIYTFSVFFLNHV